MSARSRERLIEEVRRRPVLYDARHEHHRDIDVRDACWREIANALGATSESLKREWKILRDSMRQAVKRSRQDAGCKRWRHHARMEFLLPHITRRERRAAGVERSPASGSPPPSLPAPRPVSSDGLELFFASVCHCARRLPRHLQNRLKRDTLDALLRAERDLDAPPPAASHDSPP